MAPTCLGIWMVTGNALARTEVQELPFSHQLDDLFAV
jgi:hypothetical protein